MPPFPKHEPSKKAKGTKKPRLTLSDMPHVADASPFVDMSGVEAELANLAHFVKSYVVHSYEGENKLQLYTGPSGSGFHPVLLEFQGETQDMLERIAVAFERIADAMTARGGNQ